MDSIEVRRAEHGLTLEFNYITRLPCMGTGTVNSEELLRDLRQVVIDHLLRAKPPTVEMQREEWARGDHTHNAGLYPPASEKMFAMKTPAEVFPGIPREVPWPPGRIDDGQVFDHLLSQTEIEELYKAGPPSDCGPKHCTESKACECGSAKCGLPHSSWCPQYGQP